jgi:hypothetical protein
MKHPVGRDLDVLMLPGGTVLHVHHWNRTLAGFPEIQQFRTVQNSVNSVSLEVMLDTDVDGGIFERIRNALQPIVGPSVNIEVKAGAFAATGGRKFRTFISHVAPRALHPENGPADLLRAGKSRGGDHDDTAIVGTYTDLPQ